MQRRQAEVGTDEQRPLSTTRKRVRESDRGRRLSLPLEGTRDDDDLATVLMGVPDRSVKCLIRLLGDRIHDRLPQAKSTLGKGNPCEYGQIHQLAELAEIGDSGPRETATNGDEDSEKRGGEEGDHAVAGWTRRKRLARNRGLLRQAEIGADARLGDHQLADAIADCLNLLRWSADRAKSHQLFLQLRAGIRHALGLCRRLRLEEG